MANATVFNVAATNPGGTGSTITVTLSTHAVDDILIIYVANTGNTLWTGNPAGWSRIDQRTVGNSSAGLVGTWLWRKVVTGDSLPLANPVCTLGATVTRSAVCRTIRGADLESPFVTPNYGSRGFGVGTNNPVRPPTVVTPAPETLVLHCYGQRAATNAPEATDYTQDQEVVISGTLVLNAASRVIADQNTTLSNQDASPTSGARWVAGIICIPSADYSYYRSSAQAFNANATSVTPALPAGTTTSDYHGNKDLVVLTAQCEGATPTVNTPGDWTLIDEWSNTTSGGVTTVRKWRALYTGTLDRQVNRTPSGEIFTHLTTYYNAHQTIPIGTSAVQQNASSTTSTFPALPRTGTKATIQATCVADATPTFTAPSGWTERNDSQGVTCADQTFNATGTTASASFTLSSASPTLAGLTEVFSVASVINLILTPAPTTLTLTTFAPAITIGVDITVTPDIASLTLTTFTPTIVVDLPFPATGELDNFNRTDGALGANWGGKLFNDDNLLAIDTNRVKGSSGGSNNSQGWATQYGPDVEVFAEIVSGSANQVLLAARWTLLNSSVPDGYAVRSRGGAVDNVVVFRFDDGIPTGLATIPQVVDDGDWLGLRVSGSTLSIYYIDISVSPDWALIGQATDATYSAAGHIGLLMEADVGRVDSFSGGTIGDVTVEPTTAMLTLTAFNSQLVETITVPSISLTLTTFAPTVTISVVVTLANASLTLTTFTPTLAITITVPVALLTLTTFAAVVVEVIPFPSTGVLDNANRADEGPPPSPDWTTGIGLIGVVSPIGHRVVSNQLRRESGGDPEAESYWSARTFGPDCEVYVTVTSGGVSRLYLGARLQNIGTGTTDGYVAAVSNSDYYQIRRIENGVDTLLVDNVVLPTILSGNRYGLQIIGPLIRFLADTGSGWEVVAQTTDSVFTSAGHIGLFTDSSSLSTFDDFGGGTVGVMEVTPGVAGLALSTLAVQLLESLTPASASLTLTTFAPTVTVAVTVTPAPALLTLTTFEPTIAASITVTPTPALLELTTFAPSLKLVITPASATLSLTTFTPTVAINTILTPASASLTLATFNPQLREVVIVGAVSFSLTTFAPSVEINVTVTVTASSLVLSTFAPALREQLTPDTALLTLTTFAPAISADVAITPTPASLTLTTFAPDIVVTGDATFTPDVAMLTLTGFTPSLQLLITPTASALLLTTFTPTITISADKVAQPANATFVLETFAPQLQLTVTPASAMLVVSMSAPSLQLVVQPASTALVLSTFIPTVSISADITITPAQTNLTLATFAPVVTTGAVITTITPTVATLTLTSYAPWLFLGPVSARRTYVINSGRYEIEISAGKYEFVDS